MIFPYSYQRNPTIMQPTAPLLPPPPSHRITVFLFQSSITFSPTELLYLIQLENAELPNAELLNAELLNAELLNAELLNAENYQTPNITKRRILQNVEYSRTGRILQNVEYYRM